MSEKIKIEFEPHEIFRLRGVLFDKAWEFKHESEDYKKRGFFGIANSLWIDGLTLMKIREKFKLPAPTQKVSLEKKPCKENRVRTRK